MDKKVISRRVMIRQDGDRFRFQSQSDKMPGDIPLRLPYTEEQEAEIAMLLGVIYVRGDTNGYRRGVADQKEAEKKSEPMVKERPAVCDVDGCGVITGNVYYAKDGEGWRTICEKHHMASDVLQDKQVTLGELYGSAPDATDGDGDTWQEPEPHSLTPAMAARPADECTAENLALVPMEGKDASI